MLQHVHPQAPSAAPSDPSDLEDAAIDEDAAAFAEIINSTALRLGSPLDDSDAPNPQAGKQPTPNVTSRGKRKRGTAKAVNPPPALPPSEQPDSVPFNIRTLKGRAIVNANVAPEHGRTELLDGSRAQASVTAPAGEVMQDVQREKSRQKLRRAKGSMSKKAPKEKSKGTASASNKAQPDGEPGADAAPPGRQTRSRRNAPLAEPENQTERPRASASKLLPPWQGVKQTFMAVNEPSQKQRKAANRSTRSKGKATTTPKPRRSRVGKSPTRTRASTGKSPTRTRASTGTPDENDAGTPDENDAGTLIENDAGTLIENDAGMPERRHPRARNDDHDEDEDGEVDEDIEDMIEEAARALKILQDQNGGAAATAEDEVQSSSRQNGEEPDDDAHLDWLGERRSFLKMRRLARHIGSRSYDEGEQHPTFVPKSGEIMRLVRIMKNARTLYTHHAKQSPESRHGGDVLDKSKNLMDQLEGSVKGLTEQDGAEDSTTQVIDDIYAVALPKSMLLLEDALRFHGSGQSLDDHGLDETIRLMTIISDLGTKATKWKAKPTVESVIRSNQSAVASIRKARTTFKKEAMKRQKAMQARELDQQLEQERLRADDEFSKETEDNRRRIRERRRLIREQLDLMSDDTDCGAELVRSQSAPTSQDAGRPWYPTRIRRRMDTVADDEGHVERINVFNHVRHEESMERPWTSIELQALVEGLEEFIGENAGKQGRGMADPDMYRI